MIKYLVVGLGNIGPEYQKTRHNTGFMVVDRFAEKNNASGWQDKRYGFVNYVNIKNRQIVLLKPSTFMNLSGNAVRYWMKEENIPLENLLIVVDLRTAAVQTRSDGRRTQNGAVPRAGI